MLELDDSALAARITEKSTTLTKDTVSDVSVQAIAWQLELSPEEFARRIEANREALLAGGQTESERDVSLAGAAVAERDEILPARHVLAARQLHYQGLVE